MVNVSSNEFYFIGVSLASNSSHDSSISVIDRNKQLVYLNKVYFSDDIRLFFETSSFVQNSIVMVSLAPDESLLDGKWRIHSKNYKMLGDDFKINKNNWTNRLNERLKDLFLKLNDTKCKVLRCNINLLRQSYGLNFDYLDANIFTLNEDGSYSPNDDNLPYIVRDVFMSTFDTFTPIDSGYVTEVKIYVNEDETCIDRIDVNYEDHVGYSGLFEITFTDLGASKTPFDIVLATEGE